MEIYRNIPGRPAAGRPGPGRPAAGRQGLIRKKKTTKNCRQVTGDRSPGSWAAPRLPGCGAAGPPPLYKGVGCPSPSFALLKIQKKEKRGREGEEG